MKFIFASRTYVLIACGILALVAASALPAVGWIVAAFDALIIAFAVSEHFTGVRRARQIKLSRRFDKRFAIGDKTRVALVFENPLPRAVTIRVKDEYPPKMLLAEGRAAEFTIPANSTAEFYYDLTPPRRGAYEFGTTAVRVLSRWKLVWSQVELGEAQTVKVYPNMRRAREIELKALGARSFLAIQRRAVRRGDGREFESMRDYVRGDELRHISWTATARRSKLTTRQYQIERDQTVMIALDAGRLMTGRIGEETKFETALHASLALMSACSRAGDNCGIVVFGRRIRRFVPAKRGIEHIDAVLEAFYDVEPEMIEPSYSRAFQFISSSTKKRAFVAILTDIVDKDSSASLIKALKLLRPRHLPLVATIGDRDLNAAVDHAPKNEKELFIQSASEEIIRQREAALRIVESMGGLAFDVTANTLAPRLLESYLRVKERGML